MDYQFFMTIGMNYLCEVLEKDHSRKGVEQICTIMMNKSEESSPVSTCFQKIWYLLTVLSISIFV